jgi:ArsR family transcriptional regulator
MVGMAGQKTGLAKRVQHFVESGLCRDHNASKCVKELKQLVNDRVNEDLIRQRSRFLKALSDSTRLKIIELLNVREMCVCEIMAALDLTQPTASHHLNLLENAGLLNDRREGKWVFYSLANPEIPKILEKIHSTKKPTLREH